MLMNLREMGNCLSWFKPRRHKTNRNVTLAIFGIDNAGKTATVKRLQGESLDDVAPTIGFQSAVFPFGRYNVTIYDLGGGRGIRGIWPNYYPQVFGIIYLIDASDSDRVAETKEAFVNLVSDERIAGKPILLLANKQDVRGAMDELDVCDGLKLEDTVNQYKTPCRIEMCSAVLARGRKLDKGLKSGIRWLLANIEQNWDELHKRVEEDSEVQRKKEEVEKKLRRERVRKMREERERLGNDDEDVNEPDVPITGDPFKPLDLGELTAKEERLKELKRKKKEEQKANETQESSPRHASNLSMGSIRAWESPERSSHSPRPPPSHSDASQKENETANNKANVESESDGSKVKDRSDLFITDRSPRNKSDEELKPTPRTLEPLDGSDTQPEERKKKKKRKKRIKQNQTAPVSDDDDVTVNAPPPATWLAASASESSAGPVAPPRSRTKELPPVMAPRKLEPLEPIGGHPSPKSSLTENWNLDLPPITHNNSSPNADDDDIVT